MGIHRQIKEFEVQQEPESQKKFNPTFYLLLLKNDCT